VNARLLQLMEELVRDGAHMTLRAAGGDDHEVGERRLVCQRDTDDFLRLAVVERFDDQREERGGSRSGAFCAARGEPCGLRRVKPQREDPSLESCSGHYT
jgi:hypothetical protein